MAWAWAQLPHRVRRSDGSVTDVTGAYLAYQVHPGHGGLADEVMGAPGHPDARGLYYSVGSRELSRDAPLIKAKTAGRAEVP